MNRLTRILLVGVFVLSCTKNIDDAAIFEKALSVDPKAEFVLQGIAGGGSKPDELPEEKSKHILTCDDYGQGCMAVRILKVFGLELILVEYDLPENANKMAMKIDAYVKDQWLFDDTTNEPMLERFVQEQYQAQRPLKKYLEQGLVDTQY